MADQDRMELSTLPRDRMIAEFSLWSADAGRLAEDIARAEPHLDLWHVDICDGHFAPQILLFSDHVTLLRRLSRKPVHVHLMVTPDILANQARQFAEAGADLVSLHLESGPAALEAALDQVAAQGKAAGLVLTLDAPVSGIRPWLDRVAFVTLVGTPIGIKGVSPDAQTYARLAEARALIDAHPGPRPILAADGGIREATVPLMRQAGADTVVMGSLAFGAPDLGARIAWLHGL